MAQIINGIRGILNNPFIYNLFGHIIGVKNSRAIYVNDYIKPSKNAKILDIGCGPATILGDLPPDIKYYGVDLNPQYIHFAKQKYGNKGTFISGDVNNIQSDFPKFDIVLATGILHHLNDNECLNLFDLAKKNLNPSGKLITLDGCYHPKQSKAAKYIISRDRGQNVRQVNEYENLAKKSFKTLKTSILHNLLRIPYTHVIMECSNIY